MHCVHASSLSGTEKGTCLPRLLRVSLLALSAGGARLALQNFWKTNGIGRFNKTPSATFNRARRSIYKEPSLGSRIAYAAR